MFVSPPEKMLEPHEKMMHHGDNNMMPMKDTLELK
jgi:hypothetical protein